MEFKENYGIDDLLKIMGMLRGENGFVGCPWDREQTHQSIRKNIIEETYEVVEAIDNDDKDLLREELGDVLLQVVFHSQLEKEKGSFTFDDVTSDICKKLILRHPHIFGDIKVTNTAEVLNNWENIKKQTKGQTKVSETLQSVPKSLPSLMRATKVIGRATKSETYKQNMYDTLAALKGKTLQFEGAICERCNDNFAQDNELKQYLSDILFQCAAIAQMMQVDPEELLYNRTNSFIDNFTKSEQ